MPQIQMTAIRLKDDKIIGQASSADGLRRPAAGVVARNFGVDAITEVTTLALMDDICRRRSEGAVKVISPGLRPG